MRRFDLETRELEQIKDARFRSDYPRHVTNECCVSTGDAIIMISHSGYVWRFDLESRQVTHKVTLPDPTGIDLTTWQRDRGIGVSTGVFGGPSLWVPYGADGSVLELDPETLEIKSRVELPPDEGPSLWVHGDKVLWVGGDRFLARIDIETRLVTHVIDLGGTIQGEARVTADSFWGVDSSENLVLVETR